MHSIILWGVLLCVAFASGAEECTSHTFGSLNLTNTHAHVYDDRSFGVSEYVRRLPTERKLCGTITNFLAEHQDSVADPIRLFDTCKHRCRETDFSIMTGNSVLGFNAGDSLDICLDTTTPMNISTEMFCKSEHATISPLTRATESVVSNLTAINYARMAKASSTLGLTAQAQDQALNPENLARIQLASTEETPQVIRDIYTNIVAAFGSKENFMERQMLKLQASFINLRQSFETHFQSFVRALEECNKFVPHTDDGNNILHVLCSQKSALCIETEESSHVSCCCAYNPSTEMPGLSIEQENDPMAQVFFDICSETLQEIQQATDQDSDFEIEDGIFDSFKRKMEEAFPDFFHGPDRSTGNSLNLTEYEKKTKQAFPQKEPIGCSTTTQLSNDDYKTKMIYDFEGPIEDNHCNDLFGSSNTDIYKRCEAFCPFAIPLLVGSHGSPVSLDTAEAVCFDPSIVGSANDLEFCKGPGKAAMRTMQEMLADFVSKQMIFRYGKLLFLGMLRDHTQQARGTAGSDKFFDKIRNANNAAEAKEIYIAHFRQFFDKMEEEETFLVALAALVKTSFSDLKDSFDALFDDLTRYTQVCHKTFPRTTGDQSILAICPVRGTACADDNVDNYVYCCCAQSPTVDIVTDDPFDTCTSAKAQTSEVYLTITGGNTTRRRATSGNSEAKAIVEKMKSKADQMRSSASGAMGRRSTTRAYFDEHQRMQAARYGKYFMRPVPNSMLPQFQLSADDKTDDGSSTDGVKAANASAGNSTRSDEQDADGSETTLETGKDDDQDNETKHEAEGDATGKPEAAGEGGANGVDRLKWSLALCAASLFAAAIVQ